MARGWQLCVVVAGVVVALCFGVVISIGADTLGAPGRWGLSPCPLRQLDSQAQGKPSAEPSTAPVPETYRFPFEHGVMLGRAEIKKRMNWQCASRFFGGYFTDKERGKLPVGDGGRWVCNPGAIKAAAEAGNCLVYSIGSDGEFSFERAIHEKLSPHCEIHTFDANPIEHYLDPNYNPGYPHARNPDYVNFHVARISPQRNIGHLIKELGHEGRTIHILKIDCEGCEWQTYQHWLDANADIQQILAEVHGYREEFTTWFINHGYALFHDNSGGSTPELGYVKV